MRDRYGNLVQRYKIKNKAIISAEFREYIEDEPDEVDNSIPSTKQIKNLTKFYLDDPNFRGELDTKIQNVEIKGPGCNFQKLNFLEVEFYKTDELAGNSCVNFQTST